MMQKDNDELIENSTPFHLYKQTESNPRSMYDISVVVCTYNPDEKALLFTLDSIIAQKEIEVEIIIADDGSANNLHDRIMDYFSKKHFDNWTMVCNEKNNGTVYNVYTGLKLCKGKYVKIISPGDALYGDNILREWLLFHQNNDFRWSFSDAIYYTGEPNDKTDLKLPAHPNNVKPYIKGDRQVCRWNYIALNDIALGAALLCERKVMLEYVKKIIYKLKYAEDNIWRMMMFDGVVGGYFPQNAILYEYGTGISTNASNAWAQRLKEDWNNANELMMQNKQLDDFQKAVIRAWRINDRADNVSKLFIKGMFKNYIIRKLRMRKTLKRVK